MILLGLKLYLRSFSPFYLSDTNGISTCSFCISLGIYTLLPYILRQNQSNGVISETWDAAVYQKKKRRKNMRTQKIESKKSATKSVGKDFTGISDLGFGANNSTLGNRVKSKDGGGCCCCCCCCCCCSSGAADVEKK